MSVSRNPVINPIVLIPARMASTRLPGKPLAPIGGVPMIVCVWRQAVAANIGPVVVAAAEPEIVREEIGDGGTDGRAPDNHHVVFCLRHGALRCCVDGGTGDVPSLGWGANVSVSSCSRAGVSP